MSEKFKLLLPPFPGMDPYLEAPDIWPDFHDRLAIERLRLVGLHV